jgi:hypothetical protein
MDFAIREVLGLSHAQIGRLWIEIATDLGNPAALPAVAPLALGEVYLPRIAGIG